MVWLTGVWAEDKRHNQPMNRAYYSTMKGSGAIAPNVTPPAPPGAPKPSSPKPRSQSALHEANTRSAGFYNDAWQGGKIMGNDFWPMC